MADGERPAPETAPKPGEVRVSVDALGSDDIADVGDALAGLFAEDAGQEIQQEQEPANTEQEEIPAIGDTEDGQSEQTDESAIEPPISWTADAKEEFKQLPPSMQSRIAKRESERETCLATQSQKATDEAKRLEADRQQVANDRALQTRQFQTVLLQLAPDFQRFQNTDWAKLALEKPAEWAAQRQAFDDLQSRWNMATQQVAGIQQQQQAEQEKQIKATIQAESEKLVAKVPEFADRAKLKAFGEDLAKHFAELTPAELGSITDHRQIMILRDALNWRHLQANKTAALAKRAQPNANPTRRLAPVPRQGNAREEAQSRQLGALHEILWKTGSIQSAADMLAATGIFGKA